MKGQTVAVLSFTAAQSDKLPESVRGAGVHLVFMRQMFSDGRHRELGSDERNNDVSRRLVRRVQKLPA